MSNETQTSKNVIALGYKGPDGTIVVTDVLAANWPKMNQKQISDLSWRLTQWALRPNHNLKEQTQ